MLREEHRTKPYAFQALTLKPEIPETPMHGRHIPKPRSGHRIVNYRGNIFSFGGYNPSVADDDEDMKDDPHWATSKPLFKELWCYNPSTRRWKKLSMTAPVPDQLASHTAVAYEDKMLVYGGTGSPFGQSISNTVFVLDFAVRTWSELDTAAERGLADMPRPLYGQAVALHDDKLYVVGGTSGYTYFMDVHVLDLTHRRWQCLYKPSEQEQVNGPTARYRHEICYYEGRIYVLGGGSSFEVQPLETLPAFDLETGTWNSVRTHPDASIPIEESYVEQYPRPRRCHSIEKCGHSKDHASAVVFKPFNLKCITHNFISDVYLFGGFDGDKICSLIWRLDLSSMTWKCWPLVMPKPVYFHSSTITEVTVSNI